MTSSNDWDTFKIRKPNEREFGLCMALYGPAGSGKTTLAASAADSEYGAPVVLLDAEGGTRSIKHRKDIDIIDVRDWATIQRFTARAMRSMPELPWRTVIMDNMSEYLSLLTNDIASSGQPTQPEWGKITTTFLEFVRSWREMSRDGINVILIAWDDTKQDDVGRVHKRLAFTPRIARDFPGIIDIIGHISVNERTADYERVLDFSPNNRTDSKLRRSQDEAAKSIPYKVSYGLNNMPMPDLLAILRGGLEEWPSNKYPTPTK